MGAFNYIAIAISVAGSIIIIWGVGLTTVLFLKLEWNKLTSKQTEYSSEKIRYGFGSYLLLGLDFMLAADMIHTIHNPVLSELYILALIVAIRSVISFFLHKEINSEKKNIV
ncbi:MAG TPA: DUF1622 domain-containing protein [Bacteroidia bacterium]|nr:DUF1622 domain-containing protein [Bacteroidia bacterium]